MNPNDITRRKLVGTLGAGIAAAAAAPAALAQSGVGNNASTAQPLTDASTKYPKPPFPVQDQPWPGLASKMTPRPDHGEASYKGSGRLQGRKALITGGDSGMGRAAAIAYAREGADVAINYFPSEEPDAREVIALIKAEGRKGIAIPGDLRERVLLPGSRRQSRLRPRRSRHRRLKRRPPALRSPHRRHDHRTLRLDHEDQHLRTLLDHQGRPPPHARRLHHHRHHLRAGLRSLPDLYDYAQTKAATMNFVKSLAKQLGPKGIRVNGVAPGPIWTPLQISGGAPSEKYTKFGGNYPLGRPGQPAELASIYVQLAAQDASYTTGNIYGAGGGMGQP